MIDPITRTGPTQNMNNRHMLATLNAWCTLNGFEIDPRLKFDWNSDSGCGVYSQGSYIPVHTKLVRIPKHAVLSTKNCTLSPYVPTSPYGLGAQLTLALALYIEMCLKGRFSRWFGYLQSLHKGIVDIPVFWNFDMGSGEPNRRHREDGIEALQWLRGTEVAKIMNTSTEDNKSLIDELRDYYREVAEPFIHRHSNAITSQHEIVPMLHGFYRAYSLVSSRAFVVDAYHGLCMVPVADLFNHESQHHVHLESDYHVCPECGSLHECLHDRAESPLVPATVSIKSTLRVLMLEDEEQDDYHMVSMTAIPPGVEVFNTYGETLTNAQLLTQYGFILEANENDVLTWDMEQVLDLIPDHLIALHDVPRVLLSWKQLCEEDWTSVSRSSFLYLVDAEASRGHSLALNGDGKISHPLWIIVALFSLDQTNSAFSEEASKPMLSHLRGLLGTQCCIEGHLETEGADGQTDGYLYDLIVLKKLEQVCQLILRLCIDRESKTGVVGFPATVSDVGEYFDVLPDDRPRTKLALSVVLSELSVLNKCEATWSEMLGIVTECLSGNK